MTSWRGWWSWWLATHARRNTHLQSEDPTSESSAGPTAEIAAAYLREGQSVGLTTNRNLLAEGTRRLQQQIGNQGVQLLAAQRGQPVPPNLRSTLRPGLADDMSDVRLHTGPAGADIARRAGATAVTVGRDVAFADGAYDPQSPGGADLLRHELAHTAQAGTGAARDTDHLEHEASHASPVTRGAAPPGAVLRQQPQTWSERVRLARVETDPVAKRTAMVGLVQEALQGYTLHIAPATPATGPVNPNQYQAAPAINFDVNLEQKEYWPSAGRRGRLGPRTGYFFSDQGTPYAIIGPAAIEEATPALTRMHADHELFHATHHVGGQSSRDDQELQAWVDAFTHYFHQVYQARKSWQPMIDYYENATTTAQTQALDALVAYFNAQPADIQRAMLAWLRRRQGDMATTLLVRHLVQRIMPTTTPARPAQPAQPPP